MNPSPCPPQSAAADARLAANGKPVIVGCDIGTMFIQRTITDSDATEPAQVASLRNAYLRVEQGLFEASVDPATRDASSFVVVDGDIHLFDETAANIAALSGAPQGRPMAEGVLNPRDDLAQILLTTLLGRMIGPPPHPDSEVSFAFSSPGLGTDQGSAMISRELLRAMFSRNGWSKDRVHPIPEGQAVVFAENPQARTRNGMTLDYTGIGVSFGAGRVNMVFSYQGLILAEMSRRESGDWIDATAFASAPGRLSLEQIRTLKEKHFAFGVDWSARPDLPRAHRTALEMIGLAYRTLLEDCGRQFAAALNSRNIGASLGTLESLDVVVAGGTSRPAGFDQALREAWAGQQWPLPLSNVRRAADPQNSVVFGCWRQARRAFEARRSIVKA